LDLDFDDKPYWLDSYPFPFGQPVSRMVKLREARGFEFSGNNGLALSFPPLVVVAIPSFSFSPPFFPYSILETFLSEL